ncbi:MAG TPA: hypothetical protein VGH05_17915 [Buttiauxella sp.]
MTDFTVRNRIAIHAFTPARMALLNLAGKREEIATQERKSIASPAWL